MFARDGGPKKMFSFLQKPLEISGHDVTCLNEGDEIQGFDVLLIAPAGAGNEIVEQPIIESACCAGVRVVVLADVPYSARRLPKALWKYCDVIVSTEVELGIGHQAFKQVSYASMPPHWLGDYNDILAGHGNFIDSQNVDRVRITIAGSKFPLRDLDLLKRIVGIKGVQFAYKTHPVAEKQNLGDYQASLVELGRMFGKVNVWGANLNTCMCIGASNLTIFTNASTMSIVANMLGCQICFFDTKEVRNSFYALGVEKITDWPAVANGAELLSQNIAHKVQSLIEESKDFKVVAKKAIYSDIEKMAQHYVDVMMNSATKM